MARSPYLKQRGSDYSKNDRVDQIRLSVVVTRWTVQYVPRHDFITQEVQGMYDDDLHMQHLVLLTQRKYAACIYNTTGVVQVGGVIFFNICTN